MRPSHAFRLTITALCSLILVGCASTEKVEPASSQPIAVLKPEIDFSTEIPDCETAGARIAEHVMVGMPLSEVRRLVGKPAYRFPGSWWWSGSFDKEGMPVVFYNALSVLSEDVPVTRFISDTDRC